jgi:hypothetical protein
VRAGRYITTEAPVKKPARKKAAPKRKTKSKR